LAFIEIAFHAPQSLLLGSAFFASSRLSVTETVLSVPDSSSARSSADPFSDKIESGI
jgi:hypothetical protein